MSQINILILTTGMGEADRANLQIRSKLEALRYEIRANYDKLTTDMKWGLNSLLSDLVDEPAGTIEDGPEENERTSYVVKAPCGIWLKLETEEAQRIVKALDFFDKHVLEPNKIYPDLKAAAESAIEDDGMIISDIEEMLAGRKPIGQDAVGPKAEKVMTCDLDGNALCIRGSGFVDLQESPAMFIELSDAMIEEFKALKGA